MPLFRDGRCLPVDRFLSNLYSVFSVTVGEIQPWGERAHDVLLCLGEKSQVDFI